MVPKRIITDELPSYGAARRQVMPSVEHRSHKGLNNRAENSHLPLRKRERMMQDLRSVGGLQRFTSVFSAVRNLFAPLRPTSLPSPPTFTVYKLWRHGKPWPACSPEFNKAGLIAVALGYRDITLGAHLIFPRIDGHPC